MNAGRLGPLSEFADAFVASQAFSGKGIRSLLSALEKASDAPADLLLRAGERFIAEAALDTLGRQEVGPQSSDAAPAACRVPRRQPFGPLRRAVRDHSRDSEARRETE
jgi:hypothetical protein